MAPGKVSYPSVFVVDSKAGPPPLPPKPGRRQRKDVIQTLLVILVCVALCGMAVEACFIYHLFTSKESSTPPDKPQTDMRKQEKEHAVPPKQRPPGETKPSKPMAHLTTGQKPVNGVVLWHENHHSILHQVKHKANEGKLIIEKEGYYSVYSKINFEMDRILFSHSVLRVTQRFLGDDIPLLESSRVRHILKSIDNSFLSGVFHLYKGDAVFVMVKNGTLVLSNAAENYFGLYMV